MRISLIASHALRKTAAHTIQTSSEIALHVRVKRNNSSRNASYASKASIDSGAIIATLLPPATTGQ